MDLCVLWREAGRRLREACALPLGPASAASSSAQLSSAPVSRRRPTRACTSQRRTNPPPAGRSEEPSLARLSRYPPAPAPELVHERSSIVVSAYLLARLPSSAAWSPPFHLSPEQRSHGLAIVCWSEHTRVGNQIISTPVLLANT